MSTPPALSAAAPARRENLLLNLVCNIVVPTVVLMKFSSERWLGPIPGLLVALAFPVGYGLQDFIRRRRANFVSIIGFASVLLSGGLGVLKVGGLGFAVKDAAVPTIIGAMVLISMRTKRPLVRELLYNDQVINVPKVDAALDERGNRAAFERLLARSSYLLAGSFLLSAALGFGLARYLLRGTPGTPEFNNQLGRMHLLSWPVIVLPMLTVSMYALWKLLQGIEALTGLDSDAIFHQSPEKKESAGPEAKLPPDPNP
ncbi:MAG TPA: VC0807 family protein [Opitutaceae bacterium]|nr:VC0807 family protein [Opitutaceae bacterium]